MLLPENTFENRKFTVTRSKTFWNRTWLDITSEQTLIYSEKTYGGLINILHKEATKTKWLLSTHLVAEYSDQL